MSTLRHHASGTVLIVIAALLSSLLFAPMAALADEERVPGQSANVQTGGGDASLRIAPSYDAEVLSSVSDGTAVSILEGPVTGADGSRWYSVSVNGLTGYIPVDLVPNETDSTSSETPEPADDPTAESENADPVAPSIPWREPVDTGIVVNNDNEPVPAEGLACRVDARADAEVVVRLALGDSLDVTGEELWVEGVVFLPVNCAGVGGFVRGDYIQLGSEAPIVEEPEAVAPEELATEEPATEAVAPDEVATEEPVTEGIAPDESGAEEVVTEEVATDAIQADGTPPGDAPSEEEVVSEEPSSDSEEVAPDEAASEDEMTEDPAAEEVAAEEVATEAIQAEGTPAGEAAAEGAVTEEAAPEDVMAEEPATEEVAAEEEAVQVEGTPAGDVPTEVVVTEEPATEEVATETEAVVSEATPAEQIVVTEEPTDEEVATQEATTEQRTEQLPAAEVTAKTPAPATERAAAAQPTGQLDDTEAVAVDKAATDNAAAAAPATTVPNQQVASEQQARSLVDPARAIGTAEVVGTNGDGVRCRTSASSAASTITILAEGTTVQVLSVERNGYLGVICGGQAGFANVEFLYSGGAGDEIAANAGSVTVVGTGGGLNCRSGAGTSFGVLTVLRDGTTLSIRSASSNGWAPVVCGGQNGYVSIDYVEAAGTASSGGGTGGDGSVGAAATTMVVRGTNGDGVRCRTGASTSSSIITVLAEGTRVSARGGATGGWVPVVCGGTNGYVSATYLGASSGSTSGGSGTAVSSGWVKVTGTGGGGVRCRSTASLSGAVLMVVGEGRVMRGQGAASNGWQPVNCGGRSGFVSIQFIAPWSGSGSAPSPTPSPTPNPTPPPAASGMVNGDHAKVTDRLNLRYSASMGAGISTTIPTGTIIQITGGVTNGFYPVNWDGLKGFVSKDYVVKTTAALSKRGGSGSPTAPTAPPGGNSGSNATGNSMVSFALRYEGYPYIWASHGPSGFDCSGFTYWVTKNVTGKDIGYGLWTQVSAGTPVSRASLQPGDLIFFQNTYKAGLSHSGIYIGNNRFIHAENETTGVRISDLNSTYYGSRWYGAVRMT